MLHGAAGVKMTSSSRPEFNVSDVPEQLPILPLRNSVFFPGAVMPLTIGRPKTIRLIEETMRENSLIGIVAQRSPEIDDPTPTDLYQVGTIARVIKLTRTGKEGFSIVVEGLARFKTDEVTQTDPYFFARVTPLLDVGGSDPDAATLATTVKTTAREIVDMLPEMPVMAKQLLESISDPGHLADLITANMDAMIEEKQEVLESLNVKNRLKTVLNLLNQQAEVAKLSNKINSQVKGEMSKSQREYYLRQQMKAIKDELGEREDDESGLEELERRLRNVGLSEEAEKAANRELRRLRNMQPTQAEYTVARTYLEWLADMPWSTSSVDNLDISNAQRQLDEDHYGLEKIKKRIVEYLAVRKLKSDMKGPILCFVGPPGVGKTSLGRSIADSLGRKFGRIALGGVRDEAEIRGHRRTYIGALPGRLIQAMKKAGTTNPVILLDEIDKLGHDVRGDPAAALLEVLDPEQNNSFNDHYLDLPYDLSKVLFIATANQLDTIPAPLRDRMEIIEVPGYTFEEKLNIAKQHLVPKQMREHGITDAHIEIPDATLLKLATSYTREAGVRNLEREVAGVCRGVAVDVAKHDESAGAFNRVTVDVSKLDDILGAERYFNETAERTSVPGVATGLAWTAAGGDLLFIEATRMGGKGSLILTGQLGDVMKESAQAAMSWIRSNAVDLGISNDQYDHFLEKSDLHLHFPAGAIPKDGPSAGVTITTAIVSLLTGKNVRSDTAMSGEITLRGHVLPVGGIKEKVLAAHRGGARRVILPARNEKDLRDIPKNVREEMEFIFAKTVDTVLENALEGGFHFRMTGDATVPRADA
jgi:ATP-dependent Lon protease